MGLLRNKRTNKKCGALSPLKHRGRMLTGQSTSLHLYAYINKDTYSPDQRHHLFHYVLAERYNNKQFLWEDKWINWVISDQSQTDTVKTWVIICTEVGDISYVCFEHGDTCRPSQVWTVKDPWCLRRKKTKHPPDPGPPQPWRALSELVRSLAGTTDGLVWLDCSALTTTTHRDAVSLSQSGSRLVTVADSTIQPKTKSLIWFTKSNGSH